jgi:hypothetical protein
VPGPAAACIVLATAFHPSCLVGCASAIFSDLTFCALTYLTFLAMMRTGLGTPRVRVASTYLAGALSGASVLVRGNGITLVLAALTSSLRKCRLRHSAPVGVMLGAAIVLGAASLIPVSTNRPVPSGDYSLEMGAAWSSPGAGVAIVGRNLSAVMLDFPARVLLPMTSYLSPVRQFMTRHTAAGWGVRLGCLGLVLLGMVRLARAGTIRVLGVWAHVLGTLGLFLIWPWTMILERFLLGLFPLVFLAAWAGLARIARTFGVPGVTGSRRSQLALTALVLMSVSVVAVSARAVQGFHSAGRQWPGASDRRSLAEAMALIEARLGRDVVVAARWPDTVFLETGRQAVPLTEDDAILIGQFDATDRLRRWIDLVRDRPFALLVRGQAEDPNLEDRRQVEAAGRIDGIKLVPLGKTLDERYGLVRAVRR